MKLILLLLLCGTLQAQEFKYQMKGESFPFDSGVSISHRQYVFIQRQQAIGNLSNRIETVIKKEPTVIRVPVERKKKWHETKIARIGGVVVSVWVGYKVGSSKK